jgi:ABC-type Mn2+/Zn2+ transport system ATPase subunit
MADAASSAVETTNDGAGAGSAPPVVSVRELTTGYRDVAAIESVSFDVAAGELVALIGPNGSGKSTLIKALIGLLDPWQGSAAILGGSPARARAQIGYMPQAEQVDWRFPISVREVVSMALYQRRWGLDRLRAQRRRDPRVEAAMRRTRIVELAGQQVSELSGGQQRRVLLARTLVRDPEILLLDEPASGLDTTSEHELMALLRDLAASGKTVIVATHDIVSVLEFFSRVLCLKRRLIADGPPRSALIEETLIDTFGRHLLVFYRGEHGYTAEPHVHHGRHEHD